MNKISSRCARRAPHFLTLGLALASFALLTGCISSNGPILTDGQPLLGKSRATILRFTRWHAARADRGNVPLARRPLHPHRRQRQGHRPFTLHAFEGTDLIVQSIRAGKPVEYGIARKLADGVYLLAAVDESDADEATQK